MTERNTFGKLPGTLRGLPRQPRIEQRPIDTRGVALRFRGPRELHLGQVTTVGGPGPSPPGFNAPGTSEDEWVWYWASFKVLVPDADPRQPPYAGTPDGVMEYQDTQRLSGAIGGARIDFVYHMGDEDIGVRIQSERFHVFADAAIKAYDYEQLLTLSERFRIEDAYSQDFVEDQTGQAAIVEVKRLLSGGDALNPITAGTARSTRIRQSSIGTR